MKKISALILATLGLGAAANAIVHSTNWTVNAVIPDANLSGWADTRNVTTMPAGTLQGVAVNLELNSQWAGDLYAYLMHDSGFCVLLNRVGQGTGGNPTLTYGYGAGLLDVSLADDGFNGLGNFGPIQTYGGGNASGYYNPEGSSMSSFLTTPANGTWTLFVADLSGGDVTTIQSWGLQMDIVAVPEVETWIAAALAGAFGAFWLNRQIWAGVSKK